MSSGGAEIHKVVMRYYHDNKKNGVSLKDAWAKHAHMKKGYKAPVVAPVAAAPVAAAPPALPMRKVRAKKVLINPTQRAMIDKENPIFKKASEDVREALKKDFTPAQLKKMDDEFSSMLAKKDREKTINYIEEEVAKQKKKNIIEKPALESYSFTFGDKAFLDKVKPKTQKQKDDEWSEFLAKKRLETKPKSNPDKPYYSINNKLIDLTNKKEKAHLEWLKLNNEVMDIEKSIKEKYGYPNFNLMRKALLQNDNFKATEKRMALRRIETFIRDATENLNNKKNQLDTRELKDEIQLLLDELQQKYKVPFSGYYEEKIGTLEDRLDEYTNKKQTGFAKTTELQLKNMIKEAHDTYPNLFDENGNYLGN